MDLKIPNIVKPIALKDYTDGKDFPPAINDAVIWAWVNPRRELREIFIDKIVTQKATDEEIGAWFSEVWSQGPDETHFTSAEVISLFEVCKENEPNLWWWLANQTFELITNHLSAKKKNSSSNPPPSDTSALPEKKS